MSKIETAQKLLKIAAKYPKDATKAFKFGLKYGLVGLRDRLAQEVVAEEILPTIEDGEPGSVDGYIKFSVVMPVYNVDPTWLGKAIESVTNQVYANWEICIADDCSTDESTIAYLKGLSDARIKVAFLEENVGISEATNTAAKLASGDYIVLLDDDDRIYPNALEELFLRASSVDPDVMYTDNDVINESDQRLSIFVKPDWSPDLLFAQMYIGHLLAFKRSLFEGIGGFRSDFNGSQDYDLMLRMSEHTDSIEHISKVLYSWRSLPTSTATNPDSKPYAQYAGQAALQDHFDRTLGKGAVSVDETEDLFVYDARYNLDSKPLASIVIPTKDHVNDLMMAVESVMTRTDYGNFEIIIVDNNSTEAETFAYYDYLREAYDNVKVIDAPIPFNWSKVNNIGIATSNGDVIVCLNNDVVVKSCDWLTRLVENAMRDEIGIVGNLLLYPDGTIQHAGVVVGMGGWADHVYKGCEPVHYGNPFVSAMVTRNVTAVTGACMAFSRNMYDAIGGFDEKFIVCGSDVEYCIRALEAGYRNLYLPKAVLTHHESKTRDPKDIPEIDFKLSKIMYRPYQATGDPYYNINLDYSECVPTLLSERKKAQILASKTMDVGVMEIRPIGYRRSAHVKQRLNLLIPSINDEDVYGGIATALKFFKELAVQLGCATRVVVVDVDPRVDDAKARFPKSVIAKPSEDPDAQHVIVSVARRTPETTIPVSKGDWFVCTSWWTAYCMQSEYEKAAKAGSQITANPLIYLIQDYEPGFYAWSSKYLLAESTYKSKVPVLAAFNSEELYTHFKKNGYAFEREYVFKPFLNKTLNEHLQKLGDTVGKRRQILVYGRPGTDRNAFELVVEALRKWVEITPDAARWEVVSAGESHSPVPLGKGKYLFSVGKLSIDEYATVLGESFAGISLMVSPHPSYPPLEMAAFGVQVVVNAFSGKDLAGFSPAIHSIDAATPWNIAHALKDACDGYDAQMPCGQVPMDYLASTSPFGFISELADYVREH